MQLIKLLFFCTKVNFVILPGGNSTAIITTFLHNVCFINETCLHLKNAKND